MNNPSIDHPQMICTRCVQISCPVSVISTPPPPLQYGRPRKGVNKKNSHQSKAGSTGFPTLVQKGNTTLAWIRSIGFRPRDHPFCLFFTFRLWMSFERGGNFPRKKNESPEKQPGKAGKSSVDIRERAVFLVLENPRSKSVELRPTRGTEIVPPK